MAQLEWNSEVKGGSGTYLKVAAGENTSIGCLQLPMHPTIFHHNSEGLVCSGNCSHLTP
jgi:hypothetical protein